MEEKKEKKYIYEKRGDHFIYMDDRILVIGPTLGIPGFDVHWTAVFDKNKIPIGEREIVSDHVSVKYRRIDGEWVEERYYNDRSFWSGNQPQQADDQYDTQY